MSLSLKYLVLWLPPAVWVLIIFFFSQISDPFAPGKVGAWDKPIHLLIYALLAGLTFRAAANSWQPSPRVALWCIISCVLYGALDEYHQTFVPGREASLLDWLADCLGVLIGVGVGISLATRQNKQRK